MTSINPNQPNLNNNAAQQNAQADAATTAQQQQAANQVHVSRELDGLNDTGVIGEWLTVGTEHLADVNRFFIDKFRIAGLLSENLQATQTTAAVVKDAYSKILCADDMYVAGDPKLGGKGNNYVPLDVVPRPGFYTMFKDGVPGGRGITQNSHVEVINDEGNVAFTEYGYIITDDAGKKYTATLSGGELKVTEPDGKVVKLSPPNGQYVIGDPQDPVARFSFQNVPGGENGTNEVRASVEYFEKPTAANINTLVGKGVPKDVAEDLRSRSQFTHGFRIPDGQGSYRAPAGLAQPLKTTYNGVKTYYDSHFNEGTCQKVDIQYDYPPPPPPPPPPYTPPPPPPPPPYTPPPPPPPPDYDGGDDGGGYGDPHFSDFDAKPEDGWTYDVMGEAGKTYSIVSDRTVQLNARFDEWSGPDATIMSEMGIQVANPDDLSKVDQLYFDARKNDKSLATSAPTINGVAMQANKSVTLADGGTAIWDGKNKMTVTTREYTFTMDRANSAHGGHMNVTASITKGANPFSDFVAAHGILGQTADGDGLIRKGDRGKGAQGGGALDTVDANGNIVRSKSGDRTLHNNYETDGLFSTTKNAFNRFGVNVATIIAKDTDGDGVNDTVLQVLDTDGNIIWGNLYEKLAPPQPADKTIAVIEDIKAALADETVEAPKPDVEIGETGNAGGADVTLDIPRNIPQVDIPTVEVPAVDVPAVEVPPVLPLGALEILAEAEENKAAAPPQADTDDDAVVTANATTTAATANTGNSGTANTATAGTNHTEAAADTVPQTTANTTIAAPKLPTSYDRSDPVDVLVRNQYRAILGREPETDGFNGWVSAVRNGLTNAQLTKNFFNSEEYKKLNLSDSETINRVYRAVLNREPDAAGKAHWLDQLKKGVSLNAIIDQFYASTEYKKNEAIVKAMLEKNDGKIPYQYDGTGPLSRNPKPYVPPTPPAPPVPPYVPPTPQPPYGPPGQFLQFFKFFQQLMMQFWQMLFGNYNQPR